MDRQSSPNELPATRYELRTTGLHYNKLNAPVRSYVDNLRAQVYEVFKKYGVTNMQEFISKMKKIEVPDREKVIKLMKAVETAYQKNETPGGLSVEKAQEFLGRENVHGIEDVEFALGFTVDPEKIPPIPYTVEDLQKSKEIKDKTGVEEMLVLFVADKDGEPLTGEKMNELLQKKYTEMGLGKFLYKVDWYKDEEFFKTTGFTYSWKLITKQCIPDSKNKRHDWQQGDSWEKEDSQEYAIEQFAEKVTISQEKFHRPEPFEMLYSVAVHLIATERDKGKGEGERLLDNEWHWSDVRSSDGDPVDVGRADADGAYVNRNSRDNRYDRLVPLGVCVSRDSSFEKSSEP